MIRLTILFLISQFCLSVTFAQNEERSTQNEKQVIDILLASTIEQRRKTFEKELDELIGSKKNKSEFVLDERKAVNYAIKYSLTSLLTKLGRVDQRTLFDVAMDEFIPDINFSANSQNSWNRDATVANSVTRQSESASVGPSLTWRLPTGANVGVSYAASRRNSEISPQTLDPTLRPEWDANWNISISQPLLRGGPGASTLSNRIAKINEQQNLLQLESSISDIITNALSLFRSLVSTELKLHLKELKFDLV